MIYKYLSPRRFDFLETLKIRFSQPNTLNDPFEYFKTFNVTNLYNTLPSVGEFLAQPLPYKRGFPFIDENILRSKEAGYFLESNLSASASVALDSSVGILSLSRTNNNLLMWAHYAQNFTGFVVGFDDTHPFFVTQDPLDRPRPVIYSSNRTSYEVAYDKDPRDCLFEKPLEWAYEEEVRVVRWLPEGQPIRFLEDGTAIHEFDIPVDAVKEIYVGFMADAELLDAIVNSPITKEMENVPLTAVPSNEKYAVDFIF